MIVTGYTNEYGTVIPEEDATEYIWKQARNNEEDKTWLLEYMWDVFTGNPKFKKELEELKEARFDDVCSVTSRETSFRITENMNQRGDR